MIMVARNLHILFLITVFFLLVPPVLSPFDYFKLALQWPPAVPNSNQQHYPSPPNFTIHGLWPESMTGPWPPSTCTPNSAYTQITDPNLLQRLTSSWPDVKHGKNQQFWELEWNHHGEYSQLSYDQTAFFTLGVDLKDRHDICGYFKSLNFKPGDSKSLKDIGSDIQSYTTKTPELACRYAKGGVQLLQEIRICFDPWFAVIDCPIRSKSCVSTKQIQWA